MAPFYIHQSKTNSEPKNTIAIQQISVDIKSNKLISSRVYRQITFTIFTPRGCRSRKRQRSSRSRLTNNFTTTGIECSCELRAKMAPSGEFVMTFKSCLTSTTTTTRQWLRRHDDDTMTTTTRWRRRRHDDDDTTTTTRRRQRRHDDDARRSLSTGPAAVSATGRSLLLRLEYGTVCRLTWENRNCHTASSGGLWRHFYSDSETTAHCELLNCAA